MFTLCPPNSLILLYGIYRQLKIYTFAYMFIICLFPLEFRLHKILAILYFFFSFVSFISRAQNEAWNVGDTTSPK